MDAVLIIFLVVAIPLGTIVIWRNASRTIEAERERYEAKYGKGSYPGPM